MALSSSVRWLVRAWPLALLCAFASTSWIAIERDPQLHFSLVGDALACAIVAAPCFFFRNGQRQQTTSPWPAALGGMLVLVGPAVPSLLMSQAQPSAIAITLTLTSIVVAVALPALTSHEFSPNMLWPGIVAASALLIALPLPGLADWRSDVALLLTPLVTGIGAILYVRDAQRATSNMPFALLLSAAVFGLAATAQWRVRHIPPQISAAAVMLDAVLFVLPMLALKRMSAMQYTARYTLVPLLLLAEGALLVSRDLINLRTASCALLLLAATIGLLRFRDEENAA